MNKSRLINALLPLALMLAFVLCAVSVLLFAVKAYSGTVSVSSAADSSRTALAYISEKIHRCDENGAVTIGSFDGCDSLIISQEISGKSCCTYIYYYNGFLMELFAAQDASVSAEFGTKITELSDFTMRSLSEGVFLFDCTDVSGIHSSAAVSLKSLNR